MAKKEEDKFDEKQDEKQNEDLNRENENEKNAFCVVHMGNNLKNLRNAEDIKQITLAYALGYNGKYPQQFMNKLESKPVLEDHIIEKAVPLLKCTVNHIKKMVTYVNPKNAQYYYDYSGAHTQNITFNPLEALKEQFEKTQEVYEAYLNDQKERISDQKNMINSYDDNMKVQTNILGKLAEKLNLQ